MKVILSTELKDTFTQFVVVDSFKKIRDLKGVTVLIIHKYTEQDFDAGVFISEFREAGVESFLYISDNQSAMMVMLMQGVGGFVSGDTFYLEDEEELIALVDDINEEQIDESNTSLAAPAFNIVTDFIKAFARGESRIKTPAYLEAVNNAITELATINQRQETQIMAMGTSALGVFQRASTIIHSIDQQRKLVEQKLAEAEEAVANAPSQRATFGNSVMFFTPVRYMANSKVLLIREYSPCRYLTSFVLGYLHHLHYELNRRPKLIFVHQKGQGVSAKYSEYTAITQDSMNIMSLYDSEIIATNNPKKEVMQELLNKPNDVIVVVDRLYGSQDIVTGRIIKVNAVGSRSDIQRYKVKPEDTIFAVTAQPKELFDLPVIKNFPTEVDARYAAYAQVMKDKYLALDSRLGLKED